VAVLNANSNPTPPSGPSASSGAFSPLARQQYSALAWLQTRVFINSFRNMRASFELGARVASGLFLFLIAFGPAIGLAFAAWNAAVYGRRLGFAVILWILCLVWQFFSVLAPALAGQNPDLSHLLRFPVSFGSWILLFLFYGVVAPSTLIGILWTIGIGIGITVARPDLFLWTAMILALFVFFNILLSRTILAWIERWMAQRRSREILTGIFLCLALGAQAFNPAFHNYPAFRTGRNGSHAPAHHQPAHMPARVMNIQALFPPGLATDALVLPIQRRNGRSLPFGGLTLYTAAIAGLLWIRLRAESRGENLSEAPRRPTPAKARAQSSRRPLFDYSGPVAAVIEKDLRYVLRSGPMLYALAVPVVMVVLFSGAVRNGMMSGVHSEYALPLGLIWGFLGLTRLISNNLGIEGPGIQFYFLSPTPMRTVILSKNLMHLMLFLIEAVLLSGLVVFRFGPPPASVGVATFFWILFAVAANFAIGNLLSILMPYRASLTRMRSEPGAVGNGLLSMLTQAAIVGVGAVVFIPFAIFGRPWLATPVLLVLAAVAVFGYWQVLARVDGLLQLHRESLILDLAKATDK
jgi:ABC-2 type transport system permease protein